MIFQCWPKMVKHHAAIQIIGPCLGTRFGSWAMSLERRGVWREWGHEEERKQTMVKKLEHFIYLPLI